MNLASSLKQKGSSLINNHINWPSKSRDKLFLFRTLSKNAPLSTLNFSHAIIKWTSSSIQFLLHFLQVRSSIGVLGCVYLPVSIWRLWLLVRSRVRLILLLKFLTAVRKFSYWKINLNFLLLTFIHHSLFTGWYNYTKNHTNKDLLLDDLDVLLT